MAKYLRRKILVRCQDAAPSREVELRHCDPAEAERFLDFWNVVARETTHTLQTPEKPPELEKVRTNWSDTLASPINVKIGTFDGNRLVGQIGFYGTDHPWTRHIGQFGMMIRREFWGKGLGRALLQAMESHAHSLGILKIEAQVRVENDRGLKLYTAAGYRIEGTRSRAAKIGGKFQDEYYLAKDLDA